MPGSSIGARLIAARERSKLTLENIAEKSNMPLKKLEALENDEILSENFTAFDKAYLKKYCQIIGVVYDDLFSDLKIKPIKIDQVEKSFVKPVRRSYRNKFNFKPFLMFGSALMVAYFMYSTFTISKTDDALANNNNLILDSAYSQNI